MNPILRLAGVLMLALAATLAPAAEKPDLGMTIEEGEAGIHIAAQAVSLRSLVDEIAERSGIVFDVPPALAKQAVTADVVAASWSAVVEQLLAGYNTIAQRQQGASGALVRVWVLGRKERDDVPSPAPPSARETPPAATPEHVRRTPWNPGPEADSDPGTAEAPPGAVPTAHPGDGPPTDIEPSPDFEPPPASGRDLSGPGG